MEHRQVKEDIFWVHFIKAFAIVMVIIIHASADIFYEFGNISEKNWLASIFYQSFARIGVPLFFMVSGYLLLGRQENLSFFFRKRVSKLVIPLIFWSVFFILWRIYLFKEPLEVIPAIINSLQEEAFPHLWFLYAMLGVYLSYPMLRLLVQFGTPSVQWFFIITWLIALIIFPSLEYYLNIKINRQMIENLGTFSGYLGFPVLGYLLGKMDRYNRLVAAMIPIVLISPLATLFRTYIATISSGQVNEAYFHYLSPNVILPAAASFYLIKTIITATENRWKSPLGKTITTTSGFSYGIYLIHPIFIQLLAVGAFGLKISPFTGSAWISILVVALLSFLMSVVAVWLMKKIKIIRFIIP